MHQLLRNYISEKEQEQKEILEKEKAEFLYSEGLYEKVYSGKDCYGSEYPYAEWEQKNGKK